MKRRTAVLTGVLVLLAVLVAGCGSSSQVVRTSYDNVVRATVDGCVAKTEGNGQAYREAVRKYEKAFQDFVDTQHRESDWTENSIFSDEGEEVYNHLPEAMAVYCSSP